jgi:hypothetical protein
MEMQQMMERLLANQEDLKSGQDKMIAAIK